MMEYDESMATLLNSFKSWTDALFGSVELAFKSFDADGSGSLTFSELRKSCRRPDARDSSARHHTSHKNNGYESQV